MKGIGYGRGEGLVRWVCVGLSLGWAAGLAGQMPGARVDGLARRFVAQELAYDPTITYKTGLPTADHGRFADRTSGGLRGFEAQEEADLRELGAISPKDLAGLAGAQRATYASLREQLESDLGLRVCRAELWNVNHFDGWQSDFAQVAKAQPVGTAGERAQALKRWRSVPRYLKVEEANLRAGLAQGYSAPKSVVRRVIAQMDGLIALAPEASPFDSPGVRSGDVTFRVEFLRVVAEAIDPALRRYRDFLRDEYLPKAREGVAISDLPHGAACYQALLRANTTLTRTPEEVYALGEKTVAANQADVVRLGRELFGTTSTDVRVIVDAVKARPADHFRSKEELLAYSKKELARARAKTATELIDRMPRQRVEIEPEAAFEEAAGVSSHFETQPDAGKPAVFKIRLSDWASETGGEAEIATVHEAWPGHALQHAVAQESLGDSPLGQLVDNSAYAEGWARYAEGLAEEVGLYSKDAQILRRVWPARGMVVDPGLHAMHWTRQQAIEYLVATGRYDAKTADDLVDRIAVMPGQLTSYDSGGLEIRALRAEAQARLGGRFGLKAFNRAVLEEGNVPLGELRRHVEGWIAAQGSGK